MSITVNEVPISISVQTNLSGSLSDINNPDDPDSAWLAPVDDTADVDCRVDISYAEPGGAGDFWNFYARVGKHNTGGNDPTARIEVFQGGTNIYTGGDITVTDSGIVELNAFVLTSYPENDLEVRVFGTASSGGPTARRSVRVYAIWATHKQDIGGANSTTRNAALDVGTPPSIAVQDAAAEFTQQLIKPQPAAGSIAISSTKSQPAAGSISQQSIHARSAAADLIATLIRTQPAAAQIYDTIIQNRGSVAGIFTQSDDKRSAAADILGSPGYIVTARYTCILKGGPDSLPDLTLPISSFQAAARSGRPSSLSVIVPNALAYTDAIAARPNGQLAVSSVLVFSDGIIETTEFIRVNPPTIRTDQGARSASATLSGTKQTTNASPKTVTIGGTSYRYEYGGKRRFRCQVDHSLRAGDTATISATAESIVVDEIQYIVSARRGGFSATMEISEA